MAIDEDKLTEYALGLLDNVENKAVHKAIMASKVLQHQLDEINQALLNIALAEDQVQPSQSLRHSVLDAISEQSGFFGFVDRFSILFDLDRKVSKKLLGKIQDCSDSAWQAAPFPGVMIMKFTGGPSVESATCGIVKVKPGILFPAHQHQGQEEILVLQGIAKDDKSNVFCAGHRFNFKAGTQHSFRILSEENFVFAVVLHQKNKWLLGKTLFDLMRIKKS